MARLGLSDAGSNSCLADAAQFSPDDASQLGYFAMNTGARPAQVGFHEHSLSTADALQAIADRFPEQIAFVDRTFRIIALNQEWSADLIARGYEGFRRGGDYLETLERRIGRKGKAFESVRSAIEQVTTAGGNAVQIAYQDGEVPATARHYRLTVSAFSWGDARLAMLLRTEVTDLVVLTQHCHSLERSLVLAEGTERRKIGRELHDGTAQQLVALHLTLIRLKHMHGDASSAVLLDEMDEALQGMSREIRTLSYLLHPPELTQGGLVETLERMAAGFGARTGLAISFKFVGERADWGPLIETTFYRIGQEALTNVHRHARASGARLILAARAGCLCMSVLDNGIGISPQVTQARTSLGVGIASMKARMEELGGRFAIRPVSRGSRLLASLRLPARKPQTI